MRHARATGVLAAIALGGALAFLSLAHGQQVHRNGFEGRETSWIKGAADAPYRETAHELTEVTAKSGQYSEHIQLTAEQGHYIHYLYPTAKAPLGQELSAGLWVKSNRPGTQLLARLVLPKERNPNNLEESLTTLLRGDTYQVVGRWQRLELHHPQKLATERQQVMRFEFKKDFDFTGAYIDRLVLNVYGGPGVTDVWIDDLEIGPVVEERTFDPPGKPGGVIARPTSTTPNVLSRASVVEVNQNRLRVSGKPFFVRGIRHSDTPLKTLRDAGFNTIWFDYATSPAVLEEAVNLGFWLVPALPVTSEDPRLAAPDMISNEVTRFLVGDAVIFWDLGGGLANEQAPVVARAAQLVRAADPQRPLGADVWDGYRPYSRHLDLIGVHRWPLMTDLELSQYRAWLNERFLLARPGSFVWTWVQTHLPDWYTQMVYQRPGSAGFDEPIGPQPEQIRLLTYIALATGCRGLGFWSDRFLADSHQGRDRLLALALLNQELRMLEPLLVTAEPPQWIDTSINEVKAAVLRTERGVLVLPIWMGKGSQIVPGQAATAKLTIVVPEVPIGTQAWEVSPAEVRSLQTERVTGGTKVTIPEYGLTAAIVFTSDNNPNGLVVRLQDQARRMSKQAAHWNHDLAEVELGKVEQVEQQLEQAGHKLPDGDKLMEDARKRLRACVEQYNSGNFRDCFAEAERTLRPLRILMRAQWEKAVQPLDRPVASPYALSFFTLPRHWRFLDRIKNATVGPNVLPEGGFESAAGGVLGSWSPQQTTLDDVVLSAQCVTEDPKEGRQCLKLEIKPQNPQLVPRALERTFLAVTSPTVRLQPGSVARISGWVRLPGSITASADGALFFDSIGDEPLAVRLTDKLDWKQFTLFREVPASGQVSVTLALTGLGTVYFDDIRIEALTGVSATVLRPAGK